MNICALVKDNLMLGIAESQDNWQSVGACTSGFHAHTRSSMVIEVEIQ